MPKLLRGLLLLFAWIVPAGVLIQAFLAMPTVLFLRGSIALHGTLSFVVLACALGVVVLAWLTHLRWGAIVLASVSLLALAGQTVLGYAGRARQIADHEPLETEGGLVVVHVSLGMFLLVFTLAVAFKLARDLRLQRLRGAWVDAAPTLPERPT